MNFVNDSYSVCFYLTLIDEITISPRQAGVAADPWRRAGHDRSRPARRPAAGRTGKTVHPVLFTRPRSTRHYPFGPALPLAFWPVRDAAGLAAGPFGHRLSRYFAHPLWCHSGANAAADRWCPRQQAARRGVRVPPAARLHRRDGPAQHRLEALGPRQPLDFTRNSGGAEPADHPLPRYRASDGRTSGPAQQAGSRHACGPCADMGGRAGRR